MEPLRIEEVWERGQLCHIRIDQLSEGYFPHYHDDYVEIVIVMGGQGTHRIGDAAFREHAGNVYVLQGDVTHSFEQTTQDFVICNIHYRPAALGLHEVLFRKIPGYQALFILEPRWRGQKGFQHSLRLRAHQMRQMTTLIQKMSLAQSEKGAGRDCRMIAILYETIALLSQYYDEKPKDLSSRVYAIAETVAFLETNFRQQIRIDGLAERSHMSRRTLFRAFQEAFGKTPLEYLTALRIAEGARLLLESTQCSIGEVAERSGFNDSNYFTRSFRQHFGMSPRAYRQSASFSTSG